MFVVLLNSCSSENNSSSDAIILPKKIVHVGTNGFGDDVFDYSYVGNKFLEIKYNQQTFVKYYYDGNLISKVVRYFPDNTKDQETTYQYDNNEKLISEKRNYFIDNEISVTEIYYTYETDGTILFSKYNGELNNNGVIIETGKYYYNNNNDMIKSVNTLISTGEEFTTNYTHDTKNSIFKNVLGWNKIISNFDGKVNNVLTSSTYNSNGALLNDSSYYNAYIYNNLNYPTSVSTTINNNTSTVNYFY